MSRQLRLHLAGSAAVFFALVAHAGNALAMPPSDTYVHGGRTIPVHTVADHASSASPALWVAVAVCAVAIVAVAAVAVTYRSVSTGVVHR